MPRSALLICLLVATCVALARPSADDIEAEIEAGIPRVLELRAIREKAHELGIRVWLFGGTAAAYAHYARWALLARSGDTSLQKERFDDDFTNLFRSNQDLDLAVDGPMEKLVELERWIVEHFPYAQGGKSDWELRHMRVARGSKVALDSKDFLGQHTDSHSTGRIELTDPPPGESRVSDLRDPRGRPPIFLRDVTDARLHYYFSKTHGDTSRARAGLNPPILSAIRYLTKAFQYELAVRDEDLAVVAGIVKAFDPKSIAPGYVADWIERNAPKLFQNAVNLEYAWNLLEKLGLRKKLIALRGDVTRVGSLAWWMQREPLRSFEVGQGGGATAESLGLDLMTHETRSFLAHESITRAHSGAPNVFASHEGKPDEAASYGEGFYLRVGKFGARGTRIHIRCRLKPHARQGKDFTYVPAHGYVVVHNKNALEVVPEILKLSPMEYLELLLHDETLPENERALVEKFRRRTRGRLRLVPAEEREPLEAKLVEFALTKHATPLLEYVRMYGKLPETLERRLDALGHDERMTLVGRLTAGGTVAKEIEIWIYRLLYDKGDLVSAAAAQFLLDLHEKTSVPVAELWDAWNKIPPEEWRRYPRKVWDTLVEAKKIPERLPQEPEQRLGWALRRLLATSSDYRPNELVEIRNAVSAVHSAIAGGVPERFVDTLYRALGRGSISADWQWAVVRRAGRYPESFYTYLSDALVDSPFLFGQELRRELGIDEAEWQAQLLRASRSLTRSHLGTKLAAHLDYGSEAARAFALRRYELCHNDPWERDKILAWVMSRNADSPALREAVFASPTVAGSSLWETLKYLLQFIRSDDRAIRALLRLTGHDGFYDKHTGYLGLRRLFDEDPSKLELAWSWEPTDPWESLETQRIARGLLIVTPDGDPRRFALAEKILRTRPDESATPGYSEGESRKKTLKEAFRCGAAEPRRHELRSVALAVAREKDSEFVRAQLSTFVPALDEAGFRAILLSEPTVDVFKIPVHGAELRSHPMRSKWMAPIVADRAGVPVPWERLVAMSNFSDPWVPALAVEGLSRENLFWEDVGRVLSLLEPRTDLPDAVVEPLLPYVGNPAHLYSYGPRVARLLARVVDRRPDLEPRIRALADTFRRSLHPYDGDLRRKMLEALDPVWKEMRRARLGAAPVRWCAAALRAAGLLGPEPPVPPARNVSAPTRPATGEAVLPP